MLLWDWLFTHLWFLKKMIDYLYLPLLWVATVASIPAFFISNHSHKNQHRCIFIILVTISILESYGTYTSSRGINNALAYNIVFVYLETILILYFFALVSNDSKFTKKVFLIITLFMLWGVLNTTFFQSFEQLQTYSFIVASFLIIGFSFHYFYQIFKANSFEGQNLLSVPSFWIVTFVLFFYACSFLFFASVRLMDKNDFWIHINIFNMIKIMGALMYLVMGFAFYAPYFFKKTITEI
jgi:hypothetical protein